MTSALPLMAHQETGIEWVREIRRGLLADEPGLGKSRIAIEAFDGGHNLIVAPSMVITGGTWRDELERWSKDPDKWTIAPYSMLNRRVKTEPNLKKGFKGGGLTPVNALREEYRGHWDAVVLDEAHYIKGRNTSWTKVSKTLARNCDNILMMTGTPIPNWAHEVFSLLQMMYPEESYPGKRYGAFWRWAEEWFDCSPTRFSNGMPVAGELLGCVRNGIKECLARPTWDPCEHYQKFTDANFGDRYLRRWRRDCLDLPPYAEQDVEVVMSADQRKIYCELKKDFVSEVDGEEVVAWNQGSKNVMLDKVTTSPWLLTKQGPPKGGKLEMLRFDLQSRSRPTLVLAHYRDTVDACQQVAQSIGATASSVHGGTSKAESERAIEQFKAGKLDVLCGSLERLAEGLTLTAADMAVFVEMSFRPSRNEQATFRIYRLGQENPVTIRRYLTPNTVDERKRKLLATKTDRQMRMLTAAEFGALL